MVGDQLGVSLTCQTLTQESPVKFLKFPSSYHRLLPNSLHVAFQNTSQFMFTSTSLGTLLLSMQHKTIWDI